MSDRFSSRGSKRNLTFGGSDIAKASVRPYKTKRAAAPDFADILRDSSSEKDTVTFRISIV